MLGPLPNRPFQGLQHNSHLNGYTTVQRDKTPINPTIQVVPPPKDPLQPSPPIVEDVPEEIAPEPASEYHARTLRMHARGERTVEDRAEDQPTRRRGLYRRRDATYRGADAGCKISIVQAS